MKIKIFTAIFFALLLIGPAWAAEKVLRADKSFLPTGEVNDRAILGELNKKTGQLRESEATTKGEDLIKQLSRKTCKIKLSRSGNKKLSTAEIVKRYQKGVVVVSGYYKCNRCPNWHSSAASGFMLTKDGVFCTSYHVVENKDNDTLVIMTGDGRIAPVLEVLAANKRTDLAILRVAGKDYTPLPIATQTSPGDKVRVLSHPDRRFYTLSEGIISRRWLDQRPGRGARSMLAITADFAKGSSGAPVFNEYGAVIGSVNNTQSTYYSVNKGVKDNLQMVFKNCVSMRHLLELIEQQ
ncbi:MAG: serine protease [Verrucomicrobiota bacterium]|jgi:S1-C subfamily serine protease|nr:serine protease [Verrucomicrobiota bacterium]